MVLIHLTLPFPISVNAMYANSGRRRRKSERYKTWANAAGWDVQRQKKNIQPIHGHYRLTLIISAPDTKRFDNDNMIKCVSDLLVNHQILDDDSLCERLIVERVRGPKGCTVIVHPSNGIPDMEAA